MNAEAPGARPRALNSHEGPIISSVLHTENRSQSPTIDTQKPEISRRDFIKKGAAFVAGLSAFSKFNDSAHSIDALDGGSDENALPFLTDTEKEYANLFNNPISLKQDSACTEREDYPFTVEANPHIEDAETRLKLQWFKFGALMSLNPDAPTDGSLENWLSQGWLPGDGSNLDVVYAQHAENIRNGNAKIRTFGYKPGSEIREIVEIDLSKEPTIVFLGEKRGRTMLTQLPVSEPDWNDPRTYHMSGYTLTAREGGRARFDVHTNDLIAKPTAGYSKQWIANMQLGRDFDLVYQSVLATRGREDYWIDFKLVPQYSEGPFAARRMENDSYFPNISEALLGPKLIEPPMFAGPCAINFKEVEA